MKRLLICLTGLVALTTSSCALSSFLAAMPKDAIDQTVSCPTSGRAKAERFKVLSTQKWSQGVIVLYSALCPSMDSKTPMRQVFGHKIVRRNGMTWQVSGSGSYGTGSTSAPSEQLIEYGISRSLPSNASNDAQNDERYTILYGRVLKPKVVAVEATFDNGTTLRDDSSSGVFALLSPGATGICELRVLGSDDQILQQEDLAVPKELAKDRQAAQCLPASHQL